MKYLQQKSSKYSWKKKSFYDKLGDFCGFSSDISGTFVHKIKGEKVYFAVAGY